MLDSIVVGNLPHGADAYAGYVGGNWATLNALKATFGADAHILSVAVNASEDAECLDIETGDAVPAQAPAWVRRQHARGITRPVLYASASTMPAVWVQLRGAGIPRSAYRLWSAHYSEQHICGPHSCAYPGVPQVDATQWRDNAPGLHGSQVDESLLAADFFGHAPRPAHHPATAPRLLEDAMLLTRGAGARTPLALPDGARHVRFFASEASEITVDLRHQGTANPALKLGYDSAEVVTVPAGIHAIVVHRVDGGDHDVSAVVSG